MSENLFLRLSETDEVDWLLLDDSTGVVRIRGHGSLEEFAERTAELAWSGFVYAMLAGESVLLTSAAIPSKQRRQVLQAIPYVVEEKLAADVEDCHFAIGDRRENGEVNVAVVERTVMSDWLDRLEGAGIYPRVMAVDTLLVPFEGHPTAMIDGDRLLLRSGRHGGFALESSLLPTVVTLLESEQADEVLEVRVERDGREALKLHLSQIEAETDRQLSVVELEYSPFETLCRQFDPGTLNLLQGEYKVEEEASTRSPPWRPAAILAGCAFLLHLLLLTGQAVYLDVKGRQYESEARALYQQVFPGDRNVRDIRRRWQAHLSGESAGGEGAFMDLFADAAKNLPGSNLVLNNVNYNRSRGDMVLQLQAADSKQLVLFVQTLVKLGLQASVGTINQEGDLVTGSIKVEIAGSS